MDESTSILIVLAVAVVLAVTVMLFTVPEPPKIALVADRPLDMAILDLRNSSTWSGMEETVRSRLEARLVGALAIDVFSRAQLDALLIERALDAGGALAPATAVELGTLTGVNRLITGTVYAVNTRSEPATVCVDWEAGQCVTSVPGTTYTARVLVQIEIIDVGSGQIERVFDLEGSDAVSLPVESGFGGFDLLFASAASEIADALVDHLTSGYFRELRYGLFETVDEKRGGYIGRDETDRFRGPDATAHLVVHITRMADREPLDVVWTTSDGEILQVNEDMVGGGDWRVYTFDLSSLPAGRYDVRASIGNAEAFWEPFIVAP